MRRTILLAFSLSLAGVWSQDGAQGQTPTTPPVSLAPPKAPPQVGARNSPAASDRVSSTPAISGLPSGPNPAVDYDGLSVDTVEDNDTPNQSTRSTKSRAHPSLDTSGTTARQSNELEDEALKRKLTICKNCK
ncbi:hypothetical protein WHZ77_22835 [Bradyrhizobium sp. A5]|uniref:hypothetical protein n=1 Tax=Bradyrhizobium sp. A5 TaxID=3133696 RepID=UPI003252BA71